MTQDTCKICGRFFSEPSFGGPGVCPACDCGIYDPATLTLRIDRLSRDLLASGEREKKQAVAIERGIAALRKIESWDDWYGEFWTAARDGIREIEKALAEPQETP